MSVINNPNGGAKAINNDTTKNKFRQKPASTSLNHKLDHRFDRRVFANSKSINGCGCYKHLHGVSLSYQGGPGSDMEASVAPGMRADLAPDLMQ